MKNRLLKINAILACIVFTLSITACTALFADLVTFPEAEPVVVADGEPIVSADQVDQVNKTITVSDEKVLKAEINEDGQLVVTPLKWGTAEVSFYDSENDADVTYEFKVTSKGEVVENSVNKKVRSYSITIQYYEGGTITVNKTSAHAGDTITLSVTTLDGYNFEGITVKQGSNTVALTENNTFKMPKGDVTVCATFTAIDYKITFGAMTNGSVTTGEATAHVGESIELNVTPNDGYQLGTITVTSNGQSVTVINNIFIMPAGNVTVNATFVLKEYSISISSSIANGTVTVDKTTAYAGETITLTANPAEGYQLEAYNVTSGEQSVTVSNNTFTMPKGDVIVSATFTAGSYTVSVDNDIANGSVTANPTTAHVGDIITLTSTPADGYQLGAYTVTSGEQTITVSNNTFTMPAGNVTVSATFTAIEYTVSVATMTHGSVTASKTSANVGEIITLTATPAAGYNFGEYTVTSGGQTVTVSNNTFTMPAGNVSISATFTAIDYTVAVATMTHGSVTANKTTDVHVGDIITLTATPNDGYQLGSYTVTSGGQTVTVSNNTFTMPAGNVTVSASFTAINYTVSVATMTHGSVTASKTTANVGEIITLTSTPADGYQLGAYTVTSGEQNITVSDNTFTMPAGNVTVTATFNAIGYTVSYGTMSNGSVTADKTTANVGEIITLTATPADGYQLGIYTVISGGQQITVTNNKFTMPAGNVTITATFNAIGYTVSYGIMSNGSVTADKTTANVGETITLTATPATGYNFGAYTVTSGGQTITVSNNTFTMPAGNVTVTATFTAIDYTVSIANITNGSVTASKTANVHVGDVITLTATPADGYQFGAFTVTSGNQSVTVNNNTFTMPAGNVTVSASFTAIGYTVSVATMTHGSVTASKTTANVGETITLTATPNAGYNFGEYTVTFGGQSVAVTNNTFTMPAGNVSISATFTAINYSITLPTSITGGTVTASKTSANVGETITLTATPAAGYNFGAYTVTSGGQTVTVSDNTFTMPAGNVTISATFTAIDYTVLVATMTHGSVTASKTTAHVGDTITLTPTPAAGYNFGSYTVTSGGQSVTVSNNTFTMPAGNVTVSASFTAINYTVSVATITHGSVSISPNNTYYHVGETITLTATPADGYLFGAYTVTSGGQTVTVTNNTFTMPAGNVTVSAMFTAINYTVGIAETISHGSVTASKTTDVHVGDEITLTATPAAGYNFGAYTVTSGGQNVTVTNNTFTMPAGNVTVSATFTAINYSITLPTSITGGTVTASKTSANVGETITLTATPAAGYNFGAYTVTSGGQNVTVSDNTFTMPAGNVSISATFTAINYSITLPTSITGGTVTASKTTAIVGEEITLTATPSVGYNFGAFTVTSGGQSVAVTNNTFTMPAGNVTVSATFTAIEYTVSVTTMTHGSVTASKTTANVGETITLTATPAAGYNFGAYTVTSGGQTVTVTNNTFTMPAGNVTVSATFTAINYTVTVADNIEHGTVTTNKTTAHAGETVTLTVVPSTGYRLDTLSVKDSSNATITHTVDPSDSTKYTFTMPDTIVTITATFEEVTYSVGDVLLNTGTIIAYENVTGMTADQKAAAVGVLYALDDEGNPRGWLGIYNSAGGTNSGLYNWAPSGTTGYNTKFEDIVCTPSVTGIGAASTATFTGDTDGSNNWTEICTVDPTGTLDAATNYPAFNYVNNYASTFNLTGSYATGWYMPSLAELCYIYRNKDVLNSVLSALGGTQLCSDKYWSSSQSNNYDYIAWYVYFDNGNVGNFYSKSYDERVCCVRAF